LVAQPPTVIARTTMIEITKRLFFIILITSFH